MSCDTALLGEASVWLNKWGNWRVAYQLQGTTNRFLKYAEVEESINCTYPIS